MEKEIYHLIPDESHEVEICKDPNNCEWITLVLHTEDLTEAYYLSRHFRRTEIVEENVMNRWKRDSHTYKQSLQEALDSTFESIDFWLDENDESKVDVSGITCPKCRRSVTPVQASTILSRSAYTTCLTCENSFNRATASLNVSQKKNIEALQKDKALKMTWYHGTKLDNWDEMIKTDEEFFAHLGTKQCAIDSQLLSLRGGFPLYDRIYLYEVEIDETTKVANGIHPDNAYDYNILNFGNESIYRYLNRWEDAGSISIAAPTKKIKVVGVTEMATDEAVRTLSVYNILQTPYYTDEEISQQLKNLS